MTDKRLCLSEKIWAGYDLDDDGSFIDTAYTEYPDTAAREVCVKKWAQGAHRILVVGVEGVHAFDIALESKQVDLSES